MPRIPRSLSVVPKLSVHKVWRGHNKEWNLGTEAQKLKYLQYLNEDVESEKFKKASQLRALTVMSNHTHEINEVLNQVSYSNHMRRHHSRYGMYFNRLMNRCGKVAQDRPHTCLLESSYHEMIAIFYVHANPLRAGMVKDMRNYRWSTHNLYAFGKKQPWMKHVVFPKWYLALGKSMEQRQRKYRALFARYLKDTNKQKLFFLKRRFFGSPDWVEKKQHLVREWRLAHAPP